MSDDSIAHKIVFIAAPAALLLSGTWYVVSHSAELRAQLDGMEAHQAGAVTLLIMLSAGGLLSLAFSQVEELLRLLRQRSSEASGSGA